MKEEQQEPVRKALEKIAAELKPLNLKASNSLLEGIEESLTIQRLGLHDLLSKSFATTNCIESLNSQIGQVCKESKKPDELRSTKQMDHNGTNRSRKQNA